EDKDKGEEKRREGGKDSDEMDGEVGRSPMEVDKEKDTERNNLLGEKNNLIIDGRGEHGEEVTTAYYNTDVGGDQTREEKHLPNLSCAKNYSIFEKMERQRKRSFRGKTAMNGHRGGSNKPGKRDLSKNAYVNNSLIISHVINRGKAEEQHVQRAQGGDSAGEQTDGEAPHGEEENHFDTRDDPIRITILDEEKKKKLLKMRNLNLKYINVPEGNLCSVVGEGVSVSMPSKADDLFDVDEEDFFATETEDSFLKIDDEEASMGDIKTHVYRELYGGRGYGGGGKSNLGSSSLWEGDSPQGDSSPFYSAELKNLSSYDLYAKQISTDEGMWRNAKRLYRKNESASRSSEEVEPKDDLSKSSQDAYFDFEKKKILDIEEEYKRYANSISALSSDDSVFARRKIYYLDSLRSHYDDGSDPFTNYSFEKIDTHKRSYHRGGNLAPDEQHSGSDDEILARVMSNLNGLNKKIKSIEMSYHVGNGRGHMSAGVTEILRGRRSSRVRHVGSDYPSGDYTGGGYSDAHHDDLSSFSLYHSKTQPHINASENFQRAYSRQYI
ncbi:hypothetical protein PVNG_01319, partial [Plasmodium vivax North Korean]